MDFDGFPFVLGWELTLACNLRCRHCASDAAFVREAELTTKEALELCEQFPALLVQEVDFTGGEPLLRPDWPRLARKLIELGIIVNIITNGLTLSVDTLSEIRDVGVSSLGVSVDGLEETHCYIRGCKDLYVKLLENIEYALKKDLEVTVITCVNALNIDELQALGETLRSLGVKNWRPQPYIPLGRGCKNVDMYLSEQDFLHLGHFVKKYRSRLMLEGMEIQICDSLGYFTELDDYQPAWHGCPAGLITCGITSDGKIKGCLSLPDRFVEGNLRERNLWDIWFSPDSFRYNRRFRPHDLGPVCEACDHAEQCRGGCCATSYGHTGIFHNDPYCFHGIAARRAK